LQAKLFNHRQLYFGSRCDLSRFQITSAGEKLNVESHHQNHILFGGRRGRALPTPESPIELLVKEM